ncbi:MAG: NUDIX domain-containing protein [Chlamydiales bacterium]|nr:NUDIX domain-containing protein [Chlamydiales bacterium]
MRKVALITMTFLIGLFSLVASQSPFPRIEVSTIVIRDGKILVDKTSGHLPGRQLHFGESPSACALKELASETGLVAHKAKKVSWTSELFDPLDKHYITLFVLVGDVEGKENLESYKWVELNSLPGPVYTHIKEISLDKIDSIS